MTPLISVGTCCLSTGSQAGSGVLVGLFHGTHTAVVSLGPSPAVGPGWGAPGGVVGSRGIWGVGEVILLQRD